MRLPTDIRIPQDAARLPWLLQDTLGRTNQQVNDLAEGRVVAAHNAYTAAPTTGTYAQGDYIRNSAPVEAGGVGSKYVVLGWVCVSSGTPGTWVQCRALTGG